MTKSLVVTRCDENAKALADVTHPILEDYAKMWKADFKVLDHKEKWMTDYEMCHYRILKVGELLDEYDRIVVIDSDVVIMPGCPDPFKTVDPEKIGSIYEDVGSRLNNRRITIENIQAVYGDIGWKEGYINTGVFVVSKKHKPIFQRIDGQLWTGFGYDDALIGWNIHKLGFEVQELPFQWNHMSMFSEPWNNNANRFDSYIIHYAGAANFPDDPTDRKKGSNDLASRIELINNDIGRITAGLCVFRETHLTEKQGLGSFVWTAIFGVQNREIILKVHRTARGLEREVQAFQHNIPYLVDYMGVCEDPNVGKFIMMEKLHDLPEVISEDLMKEIATKTLIALRQLWKHGVPWICRLDHIMLDKDDKVKLIDFNDDPYFKIPFYGYEGKEAIIMEGTCDSKGLYKDRYNYPLSGWIAIMDYLCEKNDLTVYGIVDDAEFAMIEYEYQALENVHQPIFFDEYKDILRRESEKDDPNYGKLVKPNRKCQDRTDIIGTNLRQTHIPTTNDRQTWLDIGCNVGYFCFHFSQWYLAEGIDSDEKKIEFATMLAEKERSDAVFKTAEVDWKYVDVMPCYDIISALSTLHVKLVEDKDSYKFWQLFTAISQKVNNTLFFEFPPHAYGVLMVTDTKHFIEMVKTCGKFKKVTQIGVSDAGRPVLKCVKS